MLRINTAEKIIERKSFSLCHTHTCARALAHACTRSKAFFTLCFIWLKMEVFIFVLRIPKTFQRPLHLDVLDGHPPGSSLPPLLCWVLPIGGWIILLCFASSSIWGWTTNKHTRKRFKTWKNVRPFLFVYYTWSLMKVIHITLGG